MLFYLDGCSKCARVYPGLTPERSIQLPNDLTSVTPEVFSAYFVDAYNQ